MSVSVADEITALGQRTPVFERLETFPAPEGLDRVTLSTDELTAICPVTGQRDFYTVVAHYAVHRRNGCCLETKTWKLYLAQFANEGVFCEVLAARMCADLYGALSPREVRVMLVQRPRGGISIKATAFLPDWKEQSARQVQAQVRPYTGLPGVWAQ